MTNNRASSGKMRLASALQELIARDPETEDTLQSPPHPEVANTKFAGHIPARPLTTTPTKGTSRCDAEEWTESEKAQIRKAARDDAESELLNKHYPGVSWEKYSKCSADDKARYYPWANIEYNLWQDSVNTGQVYRLQTPPPGFGQVNGTRMPISASKRGGQAQLEKLVLPNGGVDCTERRPDKPKGTQRDDREEVWERYQAELAAKKAQWTKEFDTTVEESHLRIGGQDAGRRRTVRKARTRLRSLPAPSLAADLGIDSSTAGTVDKSDKKCDGGAEFPSVEQAIEASDTREMRQAKAAARQRYEDDFGSSLSPLTSPLRPQRQRRSTAKKLESSGDHVQQQSTSHIPRRDSLSPRPLRKRTLTAKASLESEASHIPPQKKQKQSVSSERVSESHNFQQQPELFTQCCGEVDLSEIIGCDACDEWFHFECVGLSAAPPEDEKWYCDTCNVPTWIPKRGTARRVKLNLRKR